MKNKVFIVVLAVFFILNNQVKANQIWEYHINFQNYNLMEDSKYPFFIISEKIPGKGRVTGVMDLNGHVVLRPLKYKSIKLFGHKYISASIKEEDSEKKWTVVDMTTGEELFPPAEGIKIQKIFPDGSFSFTKGYGRKKTYSDRHGNIIEIDTDIHQISEKKPEFPDKEMFERIVSFKREFPDGTEKYGFMDFEDNIIVEPMFDEVSEFFSKSGLAVVTLGKKNGVIKLKNFVLKKIRAKFEKIKNNPNYKPISNVRWEYVFEPQFNRKELNTSEPIEGYEDSIYLIVRGREIYDINVNKINLPPEIKNFDKVFDDGMVVYTDPSKVFYKCGYYDIKSQTTIPAEFNTCNAFIDGLALVERNGKKLYINKQGHAVTDEYDNLFRFSEGLAVAETEGIGCGYINKKGETVIPQSYKYARKFQNGIATVYPYTPSGELVPQYIDRNGNLLHPSAGELNRFSEGVKPVKSNLGYYYIDTAGNRLFSGIIFDYASSFKKGMAIVGRKRQNSMYMGLMNRQGGLVVPLNKYVRIEHYAEGCYKAYLADEEKSFHFYDVFGNFYSKEGNIPDKFLFGKNAPVWKKVKVFNKNPEKDSPFGQYGYMDKNGRFIVPAKYKLAFPFKNGVAMVMDENNKWGVIRLK